MPDRALQSAVEPADYLATERGAQARTELWQGETFAMVGASWAHSLIAANVLAALHGALKGTPCRAVSSDLKVHISRKHGFVYPDIVVVCDPPRFYDDHGDVVENPVMVAEVLSASTERLDRGDKFIGYRSVPSIREIMLLSQHQRHLEYYERLDDGAWRLRVFEGQSVARLQPLGVELSLDEIYDGVPMD